MVGWFFYNEPIEAVPSGGFLPAEVPQHLPIIEYLQTVAKHFERE